MNREFDSAGLTLDLIIKAMAALDQTTPSDAVVHLEWTDEQRAESLKQQ